MSSTRINNQFYEGYGDRWYTAYDDPVALLRAESRVKAPWIREKIRQHFGSQESSVLDVGCGAGFLSNHLAAEGLVVTGLDASPGSLHIARAHDHTGSVRYLEGDAYRLPFDEASFDVVTAMDFLEHVEAPERVIVEIARVLKPQGLFFFHTFNRNPLAHLLVIKGVEWFVRNTPKDMHVIELFIKPRELKGFCERVGLRCQEIVGLRPAWSTIPLKNYVTGIVPESLRFKITRNTWLSYMGYAIHAPVGAHRP
jgi:2-polyprenyl-6-hydroxyphenyl methylase/3-demethylubiquinone-9 3-methyltransferase